MQTASLTRDSHSYSTDMLVQTMIGIKTLVQFFEDDLGHIGLYTSRFNQSIFENFFGQIKSSVSVLTSHRLRLAFNQIFYDPSLGNATQIVSLMATEFCFQIGLSA